MVPVGLKPGLDLNEPEIIETRPGRLLIVMRTGTGKDGPVISDNGNIIGDCDFGPVRNPALLGEKLSQIPGLVEHGIFTNADIIYIGYDDRVEKLERKK
jgi:ribose 5-phosphate isomerase A